MLSVEAGGPSWPGSTLTTAVRIACCGGQARIRTLEADGNRFTVCPLWPLGYLPEISSVKNPATKGPSFRITKMGKEEQASPRTARPSLKLRMKVMSSGLSLVQETADSIDEVMRSQDLMGERSTFRSIILH
jgi:hypothetical protein